MHRNPETLTTLFSSGTKRLFTSWVLVFRQEERERERERRERDIMFTMLTVPSEPTKARRIPLAQPDSPRPASNLHSLRPASNLNSPRSKSQLTVFFKSPKFSVHRFRAWRHPHPQSHFYLGFLFWHLWLSHPPRTSVKTGAQCVYLHVH